MATRIPTPETARVDITYRIDLADGDDEVRCYYRLQWRPRNSGWYILWYAADGTTVVSDWMRLRAGGRCTQDPTIDGHPPGVVVVTGSSEGSARSDLWTDYQLWFLPNSEVSGG